MSRCGAASGLSSARAERIYAECGGLMYCCRELVDVSGQTFPMLDLLPARTVMQSRLAALGYVTLRTTQPTPLGPAGTTARGHEFHYSRLEPLGPSHGTPPNWNPAGESGGPTAWSRQPARRLCSPALCLQPGAGRRPARCPTHG